MPAAKRIDDPVFGALKWDGLWWEGRASAEGVPKAVELRIRSDDGHQPPSAAQRAAYRALCKGRGGLRGALEAALLEYYRQVVVPNYRRQLDPKGAALLTPELREPREVWALVSSLALDIPSRQDRPTAELAGNCTWDEEHGFELTLRDGRLAAKR